MADNFDPYHKWLGIPPRDQPPHHYRLLSIDLFESDTEVIDAAARRLAVYVKSCAVGPNQAAAKKLLSEIVQARHCLMDPQLRAAYDQRLTAPPPGAPPVESAPAKPAFGVARRPKRAANSSTLTTAAPLADAPPPHSPAPVARVVVRSKAALQSDVVPVVEAPVEASDEIPVEPPAPPADTPTDALDPIETMTDTLEDMPAGITTLPEPTLRSKGHKSGAHKLGSQKSGGRKSGAQQVVGLADMPLPGVKSKRRKGNQLSPKMVLLGLGGVLLAVGIVAAVFMGHTDEPEPVKTAQKAADLPATDEKPERSAAAKGSDSADSSDEPIDSDKGSFEDEDQPGKPGGAETGSTTRSPVGPRGRSNATGLFEAIDEDANVAAVKKLIAAGADVSAKNKDGRTVLRMAVIKGRADLVKALLAAKASPNVADALGETPLMSAAKTGNEEIVKLLLGAGANPNVQTSAPLAPIKSAEATR